MPIALETTLRILLRMRNARSLIRRIAVRALIRHNVSRLRKLRDPLNDGSTTPAELDALYHLKGNSA